MTRPGFHIRFSGIIILLFLFMLPRAQQPYFKSISLSETFSNCRINTMTVDARGLIWLGTSCGLLRFDGIDFEPAPGINNAVNALFASADGTLLVSYDNGEIVRLRNLLTPPEIVKPALEDENLSSLLETDDEIIWFSDYNNGLGYIRSGTIHRINSENSSLTDNYIYDMVTAGGAVWTASDAGIHIITMKDTIPQIEILGMSDGLPDVMILSLRITKQGKILAGGYDGGFCRIDPETRTVEFTTLGKKWDYGPISGIIGHEDEVWLSTRESGLVNYDPETTKSRAFINCGEKQITRFSGIINDPEGNFMAWSGSTVIQAPALQFEFVYGNERNALSDVHALMTDSRGFIWYAAENGLFRHAPDFSDDALSQNIALPSNISYRDITCLHEDVFGYVWIGTFGEGLYRLDPTYDGGKSYTAQTGFLNNNILSVTSTADEIWFATLGGASRVVFDQDHSENVSFENYDQSRGLGNNFIYCVLADSRGRIWFATDGTGITLLENGEFTGFGLYAGLSSEKVYTITEDDRGNIWCATHDNTIFYFDQGSFHPVDAGLNRQFTISALQADHQGNLLIVHENGLSIYPFNENAGAFYGENYGIQPIDPEFNSTTRSKDGSIWIGTDNGLIKYKPNASVSNAGPVPLIVAVDVLFEPVNFDKVNTFAHNRNYFTFNYAGLWYQQPDAVTYRVKLEGNDLDWIYAGDRQMTYSRLSPGEYTFRVEATHNGNFSNSRQAVYSFSIQKPFWATFWFYVGAAALLALATFTYIRIRLQRLRRIETLEREKILFQFETLRSQVNPHFLFNSFSTLMSTIEDDKDMALEYVEKLSAFFRNILELRDKNMITLEEEIAVAENYIYLQKSRYGDNLRVLTSIDEEAKKTHIPPLTLQLLIENAIKHNVISNAKPLEITIHTKNGFLQIENPLQPKSFVGDSTGFGLKTIRHRYLLIKNLNVEILKESGIFVVRLPLISG